MKRMIMGLFKPDLYRNFAIGFGIGALIVAFQLGGSDWHEVNPHAVAQIAESAPAQ